MLAHIAAKRLIIRHYNVPSVYRLYTTSLDNNSADLAQSIENRINEAPVQVVKQSVMQKKKSKAPLSTRLKKLTDQHKEGSEWLSIPEDIQYQRVEPPQKIQVGKLAHGLDRVLFSPGVHYLKDPRTKHFNFTPFLENITQPVDFDFEALQPYITSSKDDSLIQLAKNLNQRYIGSTSSISAVLSQFYFAMSNFKPVNTSCLSRAFDNESKKFTRGSRIAASIYLRWKDGVYAIDVDKTYDEEETVLSVMGKSLEKVLTLEPPEFERYLKENSSQITEEEKNQPESFAYGKLGKFLLRSQLDCHDNRLPRGTFDLKTRAAMPIRLDIRNYTDYLGYTLKHAQGLFESFEREYYDMMRSAFLKYNFQVRIGHMDGILVAYHNTRKIFGFQYISREEMDSRLFGSSKIGDQVFKNALVMFETVLNEATQKYPNQTLRLSFDTRETSTKSALMNIYVEAVPDEATADHKSRDTNLEEFFQTDQVGAEKIPFEPHQNLSMYELNARSYINGKRALGPLNIKDPVKDTWTLKMKLEEILEDNDQMKRVRFRAMRRKQATVFLPNTQKDKPNAHLLKLKNMSDKCLEEEKELLDAQ